MNAPILSRRLVAVVTVALGAVLAPRTAHAGASASPGAVVTLRGQIDAVSFTRAIEPRMHVDLVRVIAADFDRDGDVDVAAATEEMLLLWVNDGAGRLTQQVPPRTPLADLSRPSDTWQHSTRRGEDSLPSSVPSVAAPTAVAHAPPAAADRCASNRHLSRITPDVLPASAPRAPPRA